MNQQKLNESTVQQNPSKRDPKEVLLNLFKERDKSFISFNDKIFDCLHDVIEATNETIGLETAQFLEWKNVDITDGYLVMMGFVVFPIGYNLIEEDGHAILITKDNQDKHSRLMKVGLPIDIAMYKNAGEIFEYFKNTTVHQDDSESDEMNNINKEKWINEKKLTEEQLDSLNNCFNAVTDKVN